MDRPKEHRKLVTEIQTSDLQLWSTLLLWLELQVSTASFSQLMWQKKSQDKSSSHTFSALHSYHHLHPSSSLPPGRLSPIFSQKISPWCILKKSRGKPQQQKIRNPTNSGGLSQLFLHDIGHLFISKGFATLSLRSRWDSWPGGIPIKSHDRLVVLKAATALKVDINVHRPVGFLTRGVMFCAHFSSSLSLEFTEWCYVPANQKKISFLTLQRNK